MYLGIVLTYQIYICCQDGQNIGICVWGKKWASKQEIKVFSSTISSPCWAVVIISPVNAAAVSARGFKNISEKYL